MAFTLLAVHDDVPWCFHHSKWYINLNVWGLNWIGSTQSILWLLMPGSWTSAPMILTTPVTFSALSKAQPEKFELPCTDVFMKIQPFISSLWQKRWDKEVANKLHAIMPQIDDKYYSGCKNRKDEVIINLLPIGHTRLTHSFRMENRPNPPLCDQCEGDHELTVKHILIECNFLKIIRRRHYDVTDLNQLFKTVSSKRILDFVEDIGLYNSL